MAHILVVDDDNDILKVSERILTHAGHQVITTDNALQAIDLLSSNNFDLLISDANMPFYSGFELVRTVRSQVQNNKLPIAMLTSLRERKDVERAVKAGVDDYIIKPLDPLLFVQKINTLLEKRQPEQKPEIRFEHENAISEATVMLPVQLESISELGVVLKSSFPFQVGQTIEMMSDFFLQFSDQMPHLKVLAIDVGDQPHTWRSQLVYLGASESLLKKIRRWILTHGASHRSAS